MIASLDGDAGAYTIFWNSSPFICVPTTGSVSHELGTVWPKRRTFCRRHSSQFIRIARLTIGPGPSPTWIHVIARYKFLAARQVKGGGAGKLFTQQEKR
jgi:hypothetical protein